MIKNYTETTNDLQRRIDIHTTHGKKDIDKWTLKIIKLKKKDKILDLGCGNGKQCNLFYDYLGSECEIIGTDISKRLLEKAKSKRNIKYKILDFNKKFPFKDNTFNVVSCCFAIYYAKDVKFTIDECHRVLKLGGKLFLSGPFPNNKKIFYDILKEVTNKQTHLTMDKFICSTYNSKVKKKLIDRFNTIKTYTFTNPLTFHKSKPFMDYIKSSLSEDRNLWNEIIETKGFDNLINRIDKTVRKKIKENKKIIMTKIVGGYLATK